MEIQDGRIVGGQEVGGEPAAVRLRGLLEAPGCKIKKKEMAALLDYSAEWLSMHMHQRGKAAGLKLPIEALMLASHRLRGRIDAFDDLFAGTAEWEAYQRMSGPVQRIVRRVAEMNTGRQAVGEAIITRENVKRILGAKGLAWPGDEWIRLLEGERPLPGEPDTRKWIAQRLGLPPDELWADDEWMPPREVTPDDVDRLVIDRLILEKLRAPKGIVRPKSSPSAAETKGTESQVSAPDAYQQLFRYVRRQLMTAVGEEVWKEIPLEARKALIKASLPWAERWRYIESAKRRPGPASEVLSDRDVIKLIAAHLPPIAEAVEPALKGLADRRRKDPGYLVGKLGAELKAPEVELALLLLGIAATRHFPSTAKKLTARAKRRQPGSKE